MIEIRVRRTKRPPRPCPCGREDCEVLGFCDDHLKLLHRVRDELGGSLVATGRYHQTSKARGYKPPVCCVDDCDEPRARGETYCIEHADLEDQEAA